MLIRVAPFVCLAISLHAQLPVGGGGSGGGGGAANTTASFASSATSVSMTNTLASTTITPALVQCWTGTTTKTPLAVTTITSITTSTFTVNFSAAPAAGACALNTSGATGATGADGTSVVTADVGSGLSLRGTTAKSGLSLNLRTLAATSPLTVAEGSDLVTFALPAAASGIAGHLTAADWATFSAKESALTFSAPLSRATNTISMPVATSSANGYLASADWITFNAKYGSGSNASLASAAITSGSDGVVLAVRRLSSSQTNNPFEIQTEGNVMLSAFTKAGALKYASVTDGCATWASGVLGTTGTDCGTGTGSGEANTTADLGGGLSLRGTTPKAGVALNLRTLAATAPLTVTQSADLITIAPTIASQAEAEAGSANDKLMTPLRVAQAVAALGGGSFLGPVTITAGTSTVNLTHNLALSSPYTLPGLTCFTVNGSSATVQVLPANFTGSTANILTINLSGNTSTDVQCAASVGAVGATGSGSADIASSTQYKISVYNSAGTGIEGNAYSCFIDSNGLQCGDGTVAGEQVMKELTANGSNYFSWLAPDSITNTIRYKLADTSPSAGQVMAFGAPSSNISQQSWVSLTATNIVNTPAGNIAATSVQTALNELDSEKLGTGATAAAATALAADPTDCTNQFARGINASGTAQCASVATTDIAANAVTSAKTAVVNTRRACTIAMGSNAGSVLTDADIGPQDPDCYITGASTVVEIMVRADGGTPNIIVGRDRAGTVVNFVSSALATAASGAKACSKTTAVAAIDGATTCSATLQNTGLNAGDWIKAVSGTAGGVAKKFTAVVVYTVD